MPTNISSPPPANEPNGKLKKLRKGDRERERDLPREPPNESIDLGDRGGLEDRPRPSREMTRERDRGGDRERNRERGHDMDRERERDRDRDRNRTPQIPSLESEMKRVMKECQDAKAKARLLSENVALATPDEVEADGGGIIQVRFRIPCLPNSLMADLCYRNSIPNAFEPRNA